MSFSSLSFSLLLLATPALAQSALPESGKAKEIALDNLLSERDSLKALDAVIDQARKSGVGEQAILEARFLFHVDRREDDLIAAMLPEFQKRLDGFKIEESVIFGVAEDWLAVVEYVKAISALKQGNKTAFKTHITEAFWLSPRQASAFAPHIDRLRLEEAMRDVKIDFNRSFIDLQSGDAVALKNLLEGRKALMFHFWSPASRECEASLPDFAIAAKSLSEKGIGMISIQTTDTPILRSDSQKMLKILGTKPPGAWLLDSNDNPLSRELRVQTLPVFVLISREGKILFNGDPSDDALWDALEKIDATIARPSAEAEEN